MTSFEHQEPMGLTGRLLISVPQLDDGPFAKSVVLIIRHDTEHAYGVIINKPIQGLMAADAVHEIRLSPALSMEASPVHFGGPCEPQRGMVLHSPEFQGRDTVNITKGLSMTTSKDALERLYGDQLRPLTSRVVAGHAGWSAGQLDDELRRNYWLDIEASPDFVFGHPTETMWEAAYQKLGVDVAQLAQMSPTGPHGDPVLN